MFIYIYKHMYAQGGNINSISKKAYQNPNNNTNSNNSSNSNNNNSRNTNNSSSNNNNNDNSNNDLPPELQQYDKALVDRIEADIVIGAGGSGGNNKAGGVLISFDDIAGLNFAKKCVQEVVCW